MFGDDEVLDEDDPFVRERGSLLEIDLGLIFDTASAGVDTLLIHGVDGLDSGNVVT